jgi:hypothetical protein
MTCPTHSESWARLEVSPWSATIGLQLSLSTVNRAHMAYDHGSIEALKPRPNGGRKHENMTLAAEEALLARFAKAAGAGEMLNIHDLKAVYEKAIGHRTSDSTRRLLQRKLQASNARRSRLSMSIPTKR